MDKKLGRFKVIVQIAVGEQVLEYTLISLYFIISDSLVKWAVNFRKRYIFKLLQEI